MHLTRAEILTQLVDLGRDVFDEEELGFEEATHFEQIKEWDSLNHMRMVVAMERSFKVRFSHGELQQVKQVSDLIDVIVRLQQVG
jgi:acyl carrier protein